MSSWSCPHVVDGKCAKVLDRECDPGMKGCVLAGRYVFADPAKNRPRHLRKDTGTAIPAAPAAETPVKPSQT